MTKYLIKNLFYLKNNLKFNTFKLKSKKNKM